MQDTPARFEGTTKTYGTIAALRGLDMTIGRGELLTLLGSNGAGKTTATLLFSSSAWLGYRRDEGTTYG